MQLISFKEKRIQYGTSHVLMTLLVITLSVILNIFITNLNIKIDITTEGLYTLSDSTIEMVRSIDVPINLYVLEETGQETVLLKEVLTKYTKLNDHINLIYKDPTLYPTFGTSYLEQSNLTSTSLSISTVIVENESTGKFKIITPSEFITVGETEESVIIVESALTNALGYVLTPKDGTIYYTSNHNEYPIPSALQNSFSLANIELSPIDFITDQAPDPANSALLIYSPHSDFTKEELGEIRSFLQAGGHAMIFLDSDTPSLSYLNDLLTDYGIYHEAGVVVESNPNYMSSASAAYLIPVKGEHEIISNLSHNTAYLILPIASGLGQLADPRDTLSITPLLSSSSSAYLKKDLEPDTLEQEIGDIEGPILLGVAIEDFSTTSESSSKLLVMSNSYFLTSDFLNLSATANAHFINNALGWLFSLDTSYAIEGKTEDTYQIRTLSSTEMMLLELLVMVIIPFLVIILGIMVWIKRRHL